MNATCKILLATVKTVAGMASAVVIVNAWLWLLGFAVQVLCR